MKTILTGLAIMIGFALYAQQTDDHNTEAPTVRTKSGIVRDMTEGDVSIFI